MGGNPSSRRPQVVAGPQLIDDGPPARVVRVLPDVAAVDRPFDYAIPRRFDADVALGSIVRVDLHGRRVRGWVVEEGAGAPEVSPKPITRVSSIGPPADLLALADWAAWRWAGPRPAFLGTASPPVNITRLPALGSIGQATRHQNGPIRSVVRLAPAVDPWPWVLEAAAHGAALVLVPSVARARRLARRLRDTAVPVALVPDQWAEARAGGRVVVGARAGAWAPCPDLAAVLVIDAHDEAYEEERAPTWNAWRVVAERAARAGVPCVLTTSVPALDQLAWGDLVTVTREEERAGWSKLEVVDRRADDPRTGLWSLRLVTAARASERVVCVLNRKGRARRLACSACGELAGCTRCGAALSQNEPGTLVCPRCAEQRPIVCASCGGAKLKNLRVGTARAAEELAALLGRPVGEVTAKSTELPETDVVVGTEAALHRVGRADLVAFVDFDAELSAPHYRAGETALALLARASRVTRGRAGGRVLVQTRQPDHAVVTAALTADPARLAAAEDEVRRELQFPPYAVLALISGAAAPSFVEALREHSALRVSGPDPTGAWLVRAADHGALCDALGATPRPTGRLRIAVDPLRA